MERRSFLKSLAAVGLAPQSDDLARFSADVAAATSSDSLWRRVRQAFELESGLIHLNCGSLGATPRLVTDAVASATREIERNPVVATYTEGPGRLEDARARAAEFIGADLEEVAFTQNTTEGMNAVATGIDLEPGDQVLTTNHEHGGGMVCWQHLRKQRGIEIVYMNMPEAVRDKNQILDLVESHLTPRTKVLSFSHIETITGVKMPMADIAAVTRPRGILLVCDGAQAPGMLEVDVSALNVDAYTCSSHKWLLAPKGTGLLYINKKAQDRIHPAFLYDGYHGYTASGGTRDVAKILGLGLSMDFHDAIGRERVEARSRELVRYLRARLEKLPGLRPLTPVDDELSGAILTCALTTSDSGDIVARMRDEHHIILKLAQSTYAYCAEDDLPRKSYNAIRFSTHVFNDEAEIDRTVDALGKMLA